MVVAVTPPGQRCNTCVLPRSTHLVDFDAAGTCKLCRTAGQVAADSEDRTLDDAAVNGVIDAIRTRGKGHSFDCVVGVSGGRDSSYLLHLLVKKHQLRCLAAYYRTPFTIDIIDANVRRLTARLGVPLVEMDISPEYHRRVARELVLLWAQDRQSVTINMACAPCKQVNRELFRVAAARDIATIVAGANVFEAVQVSVGQPSDTTIIAGEKATEHLGLQMQIRRMLLVVRKGIDVLRTSTSLWQYLPLGVEASVMYIGPHTPYLRLRYPGIRAVEYFYYANWDETSCRHGLQEVGWELPPGFTSTWKADCTFAELKNQMFYQTVGMTYLEAFLSNMVRGGVLTRDEALRRLEMEGKVSDVRLADARRVLDLPDDFCAS
jgi:hypothetical protein